VRLAAWAGLAENITEARNPVRTRVLEIEGGGLFHFEIPSYFVSSYRRKLNYNPVKEVEDPIVYMVLSTVFRLNLIFSFI
jgi:hypothetical protein